MSDQVDSSGAGVDTNASQAAISQQGQSETQPGNLPAGAALGQLALSDPDAREHVRRELQADKDRGIAALQKEFEDFKKQFGNSQVDGGGQKPAETQQAASSTEPSSATTPVDLRAIKKAFPDIDFNTNTKALEAYSVYKNDQKGLLAALGEIKMEMANKPKASPTDAVMPGGGNPPSSQLDLSGIDDPEELTKIWLSGGKK